MTWLVTSLRRLREERAPTLVLAGLVLVTAAVFATGPRLLTRIADTALHDEIAAAPVSTSGIELDQVWRIGAPPNDPLDLVEAEGARLDAELPESLRALVATRSTVIETPRWRVFSDIRTPTVVTLRIQPSAIDGIRFVSGRAPTGATRRMAGVDLGNGIVGDATVFEAALSTATLEQLRISVGQTVLFGLDPSDSLVGNHRLRAAIDVVGAFEVADPVAPAWYDDTALDHPTIFALSPEIQFLDATALLAPAAYPSVVAVTELAGPALGPGPAVGSGLALRYAWRRTIDPGRLSSDATGRLVADLRRVEATFPAVGTGPDSTTTVRSGLLRLVSAYDARWRSALAVLTIAAIGPAVVAGSALGLVALFTSGRRRAALAIGRSRGASAAQLIGSVAAEGLVVAGPACTVAVLVALALVPGGPASGAAIAAGAVGLAAVVLLVATALPTVLGPAAGTSRGNGIGQRSGPRRLAVEGLVVALAIAGAWLLRERGIRGGSTAGELGGADPFIAAAPALVGVAAGLVAVRLFALPMALLARIAGLARGLVPVLALRRATRDGRAASVLLVVLATVAIGAFSSATLVHLDRAAGTVAWQDVGAPFRASAGGGPLRAEFDPSSLPGVSATAGADRVTAATSGTGNRLDVLALDLAAYARLVAGTLADPGIPDELLTGGSGPIPAIVATAATTGVGAIVPGATFDVVVAGQHVALRAAVVRDAFPTMSFGTPFVVFDRARLQALQPSRAVPTTDLFIAAPDGSAAALRAAAAPADPAIVVAGRAEREAAIRAAPVIAAVSIGVAAAALVTGLYAALALTAALALAGAARAIEVAHLRMIGLTRREALGLVVVEHGPTVAIAFAGGLALGYGLFLILRPGLGLAAVIGSTVDVPTSVEPTHLALLLLATVAIVSIGIGAGAALQRGADPATAVRRGIE